MEDTDLLEDLLGLCSGVDGLRSSESSLMLQALEKRLGVLFLLYGPGEINDSMTLGAI